MHGQVQVTMPNSKMNGTLITVDIGALGLAPPTARLFSVSSLHIYYRRPA